MMSSQHVHWTNNKLDCVVQELQDELANCRHFSDVKDVRDRAEAIQNYARSARLSLDVQNKAAEVRLYAERQAGTILSQMRLRGGDRRSNNHNNRAKLQDLDISQDQSTRWQQVARVNEIDFRRCVEAIKSEPRQLTTAALMKLVRRIGKCDEGSVQTKVTSDCEDPSNEGRHLLLEELSEHLGLLEGIIARLIECKASPLSESERRHIGHLLKESRHIVVELQRSAK